MEGFDHHCEEEWEEEERREAWKEGGDGCVGCGERAGLARCASLASTHRASTQCGTLETQGKRSDEPEVHKARRWRELSSVTGHLL